MRFYTSMVLMLFYVRCSTNLIKIADYIILDKSMYSSYSLLFIRTPLLQQLVFLKDQSSCNVENSVRFVSIYMSSINNITKQFSSKSFSSIMVLERLWSFIYFFLFLFLLFFGSVSPSLTSPCQLPFHQIRKTTLSP